MTKRSRRAIVTSSSSRGLSPLAGGRATIGRLSKCTLSSLFRAATWSADDPGGPQQAHYEHIITLMNAEEVDFAALSIYDMECERGDPDEHVQAPGVKRSYSVNDCATSFSPDTAAESSAQLNHVRRVSYPALPSTPNPNLKRVGNQGICVYSFNGCRLYSDSLVLMRNSNTSSGAQYGLIAIAHTSC
ncbi:hypothetical protein C8Q80DRAFT_1124111 [Daedaleopsis nitida]|nr:hypothetical protein C8Q80DRAFT_1124111 [Daedaleopsis nitida]